MAGFPSMESVDTSTEMAGFAARSPARRLAAICWPPGSRCAVRGRPAVHTGRLRDPPHRPAQAAESKNLLLRLLIQDVAHPGEGPWVRRRRQRLGRRQLMAGFAVSINGWIWVSTEGREPLAWIGLVHGFRPAIRPTVFVPEVMFDRMWALAGSQLLKHAYLVVTRPHYQTAYVVHLSLSTDPEE